MRFSESSAPIEQAEAAANSLIDWWQLAGVPHGYADQPAGLLDQPVLDQSMLDTPLISKQPHSKQPHLKQAVNASNPSNDPLPNDRIPAPQTPNYPGTLEEMTTWLLDPDNLLERSWGRQFVQPVGAAEPDLMIITAMPEQAGLANGSLFSPKSDILMTNMLAAINVERENCHFSSIALTRAIDGQIDPGHRDKLLKRTLHMANLVRPKQFLLLGDMVAKMFFGEDLLTARKKKQFVNHQSSKTGAIVTFHPRILIERPLFKAEAWKDLQRLTRTANP